jgi:hypothetical protein
MPRFLISFPAEAMRVPAAELPEVGRAAHAVIAAAEAAGVCVFAGGVDGGAPPALVSPGGEVVEGASP